MKNVFKELIGKTVDEMYVSQDQETLIIKSQEEVQLFKVVAANEYSSMWFNEINVKATSGVVKNIKISEYRPLPQKAWDEDCSIVLEMTQGNIEILINNSLNPNQSADYGTIDHFILNKAALQDLGLDSMNLVYNSSDNKSSVIKPKFK
jgi:hypothetical protein